MTNLHVFSPKMQLHIDLNLIWLMESNILACIIEFIKLVAKKW